jgi:Tol biopolymer transport system component
MRQEDKNKMMTSSSFYPKLRLVVIVGGLALASCVLALLATHKPADAAFPGTNGKIAFVRSPTGISDEPENEIYTITPDGTIEKRLTNNSSSDHSPAFSADGSRIAFISHRNQAGRPDVYTMNPNGFGVYRVTRTSTAHERDPAWAPDGMKIAFVRDYTAASGNTQEDIFVINADGTNEIQLTDTERGANGMPTWSPDGSKIVFARRCDFITDSCVSLGADLWVMNADGTDQRKFSTDPLVQDCQGIHPDWSPDGTKVVFVCGAAGGKHAIYRVNADGSGLKRLTTSIPNSVGDDEPVWSPNGRKIAFTRALEGQLRDIYEMQANGTNITNLTNTPEMEETSPSWQPRLAPAG